MLLGTASGAALGTLGGIAHRELLPYSMIEAPEHTFEMPVFQMPTPTKKPGRQKRANLLPAVAGAAVAAPAAYKVTTMVLDNMRRKELDKMLEQQDVDLDEALITEQMLTAKRAQVEEAIEKVAKEVYSAAKPQTLSDVFAHLDTIPPLQKKVLLALALSAGGLGAAYGVSRGMNDDPQRKKMENIRKTLATRLRAGDMTSPIVLRVRQSTPSTVPLKPGASAMEPSYGRDVLEGI